MQPFRSLTVAYRAIMSNKARSMLTSLGVIIGVAAVVSLVSTTQGASRMIGEQFERLGGKAMIISPLRTGGGLLNLAGGKPLTVKDANSIREMPDVEFVSEIIRTKGLAVYGKNQWATEIVGVSRSFTFINDWFPGAGTFFSADDIENSRSVCVIGATVAEKLFGASPAAGGKIRISGVTCTVAGVMQKLGAKPGGADQDDIILMPYSTVQKRILSVKHLSKISIAVKNSEMMETVFVEIASLMRRNHGIEPGQRDDFVIRNNAQNLERIAVVTRILRILLISIASISLIVGGVGIMNIMLVSVSERTKEIGIRMAVGARESDILRQFLVESLSLSLAGGAVGIVLGAAISKVSSLFTGWPVEISFGAIAIACLFSAAVGVGFGIYPARKAAKLNPVEALRHD
ncbi:MAG: ABC transporter permease [Thermodesulfobacteriota bacterium]